MNIREKYNIFAVNFPRIFINAIMEADKIEVKFAEAEHAHHAPHICDLIYESALQRGTGIARRSNEYIAAKITGGKAVVALDGDGDYVATSGLIVDPEYRHLGLAARIKEKTFELARTRFPYAKLFSITTSLPVMKLNSRMGYKPVTFSELTDDEEFWQGCINYDILQRNNRRMCLCTGMLFDPAQPLPSNTAATPYIMAFGNKLKKLFRIKK